MDSEGCRTPEELAEVAERAASTLEGRSAADIVAWAVGEFGDRLCVTSSFADAVLAHMVSRLAPGIDVIFLDTGYHFAETLHVRDLAMRMLPVTVHSVQPRMSVAEQDAAFGARLYERDPDRCCAMRKVEPLERALARYEAWAAGLRRDESPSRADTPVVSFDRSRGKVKIAPLAAWTQGDVDAYIAEYDVPVNELLDKDFTSIGCWPCSRPTRPGEDPRAGRWQGFDKTECGLHRP